MCRVRTHDEPGIQSKTTADRMEGDKHKGNREGSNARTSGGQRGEDKWTRHRETDVPKRMSKSRRAALYRALDLDLAVLLFIRLCYWTLGRLARPHLLFIWCVRILIECCVVSGEERADLRHVLKGKFVADES